MKSEKCYSVYIMTNRHNTTLYTGVTSDLNGRVFDHKHGQGSKFVKRYNLHKLVYFEDYGEVLDAIDREKSIKGMLRSKKIALVESVNPGWEDLYAAFSL